MRREAARGDEGELSKFLEVFDIVCKGMTSASGLHNTWKPLYASRRQMTECSTIPTGAVDTGQERYRVKVKQFYDCRLPSLFFSI